MGKHHQLYKFQELGSWGEGQTEMNWLGESLQKYTREMKWTWFWKSPMIPIDDVLFFHEVYLLFTFAWRNDPIWIAYTHLKFNSSPLKSYHPKKEDSLPIIHFQGQAVKLPGSSFPKPGFAMTLLDMGCHPSDPSVLPARCWRMCWRIGHRCWSLWVGACGSSLVN